MSASALQFRRRWLSSAVFAGIATFVIASPLTLVANLTIDPPRGLQDATIEQRVAWFVPIAGETLRNFTFDLADELATHLPIPVHLPIGLRGPDYITWLWQHRWSAAIYGRLTIGALGGLAFALPFSILTGFRSPRTRPARWVEGPQLIDGRRAVQGARAASARAIARTGRGIDIAPAIPIAREREIRSLLILGAQRSGKTVVLRSLLRQLWSQKAKLVVHDTKGDMTETWPSEDSILLAPQDARSCGWDIGRDLRGELATFEFASALLPEGKDPQWAQGAQIILTAILTALQRQFGTAWGWREFCDALQLPPAKMKELVAADPIAVSLLSIEETTEQFTKNAQSYVNSLFAPLIRLVRPLSAAWGDLHPKFRVSLTAWLDDRSTAPRTLILQRMPQFPETSRLWITAAIRHMVAVTGGANFPDSSERHIWFIMDEFTKIGKIPNLFDLPATHASKGVRLAVALQSLGQAKEVYGPEAPDQLASLSGTKIIMKLEKSETANYVVNVWIGKWRYQVPTTVSRSGADGKSYTVTEWQDKEPENLMLSGEFLRLGPHGFGVRGFVLGLDDNVYELDWPYEEWPKQRDGAVPASWITALPPAQG